MKRKNLIRIIVAAIIVAAVVVAAILLIGGDKPDSNEASGNTETYKIDGREITVDASASGIEVLALENIAGQYVEDGSDDVLESIMTVTLKNTGGTMITLAQLTLCSEDSDATYSFEATSIPAGATVRVMEKNRAVLLGDDEKYTMSATQLAWDSQGLGLCSDKLSITPRSNGFIVKNLSNETLNAGDVGFYFKNIDNDIFIGGITYSISNPTAIEPGEEIAIGTAHFDEDSSQIVFVIIK